MLKITFYPNDEARIVGTYVGTLHNAMGSCNCRANHNEAEAFKSDLQEQSRDGAIDAQIVTIRKPGAYVIPKLEKVNDVFNSLV